MRLALFLLILLAACGRPLTPNERGFVRALMGEQLDPRPVRVARFTALTSFTTTRPRRPRLACRERILPEPDSEVVTVSTAAFVTFNRMNMAEGYYAEDYLPQWPRRMSLAAAMLFAHEITHVWQWQNRRRTGYAPWKAAAEHAPGRDPYLLELSTRARFLDYPYEQQGAIVEEYVCCRALDPRGARTKRLHALLSGAFPVAGLDQVLAAERIDLPWSGAKTKGICSR